MQNIEFANIYFLSSLGAGFIIFLLAVYVVKKNPYSIVNKFFSAYAFCVSLWVFGEAIDAGSSTAEISLLWGKIGGIGGMLIGPIFLLFIFAFTRNHRLLNNFSTYIVLLGISLFLYSWLVFLRPIPVEELIKMPWGWGTENPQDIISIFGTHLWAPLLMGIGLLFCWQFLGKTKDTLERKQALFIILAGAVPLSLFLLSDFILPRLNLEEKIIATSKFLFAFSSLVLVIPLAYAALKYKLFAGLTPAATADTIIETMKDILILTSPSLKIDFANSSTSRILGYGKDELIGQSLELIFQKSDWQKFKEEAIPKIEKERPLVDLEINLLAKDKKSIPFSLATSVLRETKKKPIGLVILAKDIRETRELIYKIQEKSLELTEKIKELEFAGQEAEKTRLATLNILEDVEEARTALQERVEDLEKFNKLAVGRELKMIELKEEIKKLQTELAKNEQ